MFFVMYRPYTRKKGQTATILTVLIAFVLLATSLVVQEGRKRINRARVRIAAESGAMFLNSQVGSYAHYLSEKYLKGKRKTKCKRNWFGLVMTVLAVIIAIVTTAFTAGTSWALVVAALAVVGGAIGYAAGGANGMMMGMMIGAAIGSLAAGLSTAANAGTEAATQTGAQTGVQTGVQTGAQTGAQTVTQGSKGFLSQIVTKIKSFMTSVKNSVMRMFPKTSQGTQVTMKQVAMKQGAQTVMKQGAKTVMKQGAQTVMKQGAQTGAQAIGKTAIKGYIAAGSMSLSASYDQFVQYPRALDKVRGMFKKFGEDTKGYIVYQTLYYMANQLIDDPGFHDKFADAIDSYLRSSAHLTAGIDDAGHKDEVESFLSGDMRSFWNNISGSEDELNKLPGLFKNANSFISAHGGEKAPLPMVRLAKYYSECYPSTYIGSTDFVAGVLYENSAKRFLLPNCAMSSFETFYDSMERNTGGNYSIMADHGCMIKDVWYCPAGGCGGDASASAIEGEEDDKDTDSCGDSSWHARIEDARDTLSSVNRGLDTLYSRISAILSGFPPPPLGGTPDPYKTDRQQANKLLAEISSSRSAMGSLHNSLNRFASEIQSTFNPMVCDVPPRHGGNATYSFDYTWNDAMGRPHRVYVGVWNFNLAKIKVKSCFLGSKLKLKHYRGNLYVIAERDGYSQKMESHYYYKNTGSWFVRKD